MPKQRANTFFLHVLSSDKNIGVFNFKFFILLRMSVSEVYFINKKKIKLWRKKSPYIY